MKLLKTLAIIFFGLILFAGVASYSGASEKSSTNIGEQIDQLESAINNGQIITDGIIEDDENPDTMPNVIGDGAAKVGEKVTSGFSYILKSISDIFQTLLGWPTWEQKLADQFSSRISHKR